ncbi:cation:proton antiporter [Pararhizobium sp. PWRC1-1]|uniref:cation:proton antiporter domain-containing protein n=1 Tax=Pararhizobium sp. PWRC1-1 TaxID=2804566 RepID=UPI003CF3BC3B
MRTRKGDQNNSTERQFLAWSPYPLLPSFNPLENREFTERMTEIVVIVALMGAGLKIDRPIGWRRWRTTWRLLGIAMLLTIGAIAFLGFSILGLGLACPLLLGAALAPTDPVLASDIQVGPPGSGIEDEVRFALTSEAGLNDGLSFPFVHLAIAIALAAKDGSAVFQHWAAVDILWRLGGLGWGSGKLFGWLAFKISVRSLSRTKDRFVALGIRSRPMDLLSSWAATSPPFWQQWLSVKPKGNTTWCGGHTDHAMDRSKNGARPPSNTSPAGPRSE